MLRPVVVGLDGSPESLAATDWAAREALRRGLPLRLVHAGEGLAAPTESDLPELEAPRDRARRLLRLGMDRVNERYPQVSLSAEQIPRPAPEAMAAQGEEAELLVLGSRAFTGLGGLLAGSVAQSAVARVARPVVLVRAEHTPADEHEPDGTGGLSAHTPYRPLAVGVDPAQRCDDLLAFAFESARLRSAPLRVVYAWRLPYVPSALEARARRELGRKSRQVLEAVLAPWREKYPTVEVVPLAGEGRPAHRLLDASRDCGLLIVGRRIRPAGIGPHTGPVAHAALRHVRCPVAVVPHE